MAQDSSPAPSRNTSRPEIVITGVGVVSPLGIGSEVFWNALLAGESGVRLLPRLEGADLPVRMGADVQAFEPKKYVRPRKSLKVMSRDIQLAFAAADLAHADTSLDDSGVAPERLGVTLGADWISCDADEIAYAHRHCYVDGKYDRTLWGAEAMRHLNPLWMLKFLPNMSACHIGIAHDARGPNNSVTSGLVSSLLAIAEAVRVIERGDADMMLAGGTGCFLHPHRYVYQRDDPLITGSEDPTGALRPFDANRRGTINGEGSATFALERRDHAEARGAKIYARVLGYASRCEPWQRRNELTGSGVAAAITGALADARMTAQEVGHVNAHGIGTQLSDVFEARAIRETLGDVPVMAMKSYFGNLGAGSGAVEMAASVLGLNAGIVPPTRNYETPDPDCPINVIHGEPLIDQPPTAMILNHSTTGQAVAMLLGGV